MEVVILYLFSAVAFVVLSILWQGLLFKKHYQDRLGSILTKQVQWQDTNILYFLYVIGIIYFAVLPAIHTGSWSLALLNGAFLGFLCYATYNLTNLASIKGWPMIIVVIDILKGSIISGIVAVVAFLVGTGLLHLS